MTSTQAKRNTLSQVKLEELILRKEGLKSLIYGVEIITRLDNQSLFNDDSDSYENHLSSLVEDETKVYRTQIELIDGVISKFGS